MLKMQECSFSKCKNQKQRKSWGRREIKWLNVHLFIVLDINIAKKYKHNTFITLKKEKWAAKVTVEIESLFMSEELCLLWYIGSSADLLLSKGNLDLDNIIKSLLGK